MTSLVGLALPLAAMWCFGLTVVSAIVPWVNAEVIVASLPAVAETPVALAVLVVVATIGQMAGKCVVYWTARRGTRTPSAAVQGRIDRWRRPFERHAWAPAAFVLLSSIVGLPPFYLTTMLAGAVRMNFTLFLVAGTTGRLVRFGALVVGVTKVFGAA